MDSLSFLIPEQHPPTKDAFDVRPQATERWITELPMGDTGEAAKRLFVMLQETNRLQIASSSRAELLEKISPSLDSVLNTLLHHYTGLSFPLPQKRVRIAQFANRLLTEAVIAYQSVLNAREDASWLFRMTHHHLWAQSIHRMIVFLDRILSNYRLIHRPYPAGVWLALHQLYSQAQRHGSISEKIVAPGKPNHRTTIDQEYKRALLLSLIEPQLFRSSQMGEVQATMRCWINEVRLGPAKRRCEEVAAYCIRADQDTPYTVMTEQCDQECNQSEDSLLLDLTALSKSLDKALEKIGESPSIHLRGCKAPVSRETLETLRQCWRPPKANRPERHQTDTVVQAAIGMSAINALLRRETEPESAQGISDQEAGEVLSPLFDSKMPEPKPNTTETEVWDAIFYGTELGQNAWAMDAEEKNYQFIKARQLNYTETGRCLAFVNEDVESLQVGELVGFRESQAQGLELYMVRWLKDNGDRISVGLMRLAAELEPVLVLRLQGEAAQEHKTGFRCLLGIGEDHHPQLFLPYLPGQHEKSLFLAVDNRELPLTLHEKIALSPLFEAYHFSIADSLYAPSNEEALPLTEVNNRLHRIAQSTQARVNKDIDDFSDVWESL